MKRLRILKHPYREAPHPALPPPPGHRAAVPCHRVPLRLLRRGARMPPRFLGVLSCQNPERTSKRSSRSGIPASITLRGDTHSDPPRDHPILRGAEPEHPRPGPSRAVAASSSWCPCRASPASHDPGLFRLLEAFSGFWRLFRDCGGDRRGGERLGCSGVVQHCGLAGSCSRAKAAPSQPRRLS